jgi:hypothetical protein
MNTWNTLPESYQQRVYDNPPATVKSHIQQVVNAMPAVVISLDAARVDNGILPDYFTSEVALEEPEIGITDPNIPIDNNCTDDEVDCGIPGGSGDYEDEGDENEVRNNIHTCSLRQQPITELERFDVGTNDVHGYEGDDGDDAYMDEEQEVSQANDGSTKNVEDEGIVLESVKI